MKKKKSNAVHIICVLDRSGSMSSLAVEVINSFNNFLIEQKAEKGKAFLTLVLFDDKYEVLYDRVDIQDVNPLNDKMYYARGMTGLYDAIGKAINSTEDKDAMVLIQTDGYENSSQEYNQSSIKELISKKEKLGWDFIFLGANIDTMAEGSKMGLDSSKSMSFEATDAGVMMAYNSMDMATKSYRSAKLAEWEDLDIDKIKV